ncbi:MAG: sigma-70 family RNA polymerase sigma factor [Gemmatimonadota bacterium]
MRLPWPWPKRPETELAKVGFVEEAVPEMGAVYRFALRLTRGDESEAEDVVQETFSRAYRSWDSYERGTRCRSWLFTICRHEFLRLRERDRKHVEAVQPDAAPDAEALAAAMIAQEAMTANPEQAFFESLLDDAVILAIDKLPIEFRETLVMSDLQDLPNSEVARILEIPIGTVKSRLYRGRRLLQQALYEYAVEMGYVRPGAM